MILISSSSVNVPSSYVGAQSIFTATPAGMTFGTGRTWGYLGAASGLNPLLVKYICPATAGVYDWSTFDQFFASNASRDAIVTLGQPADWMISRAAIGGAVYGGKANMCPTGATELTTNYIPVITAMVQRAKNTYGKTGLKWELWNEIEGPGMYGDAQSALGPYAKAVSQAIKAVDPTAIVLTPSARDDDTAFLVGNFLSVSDGSTGKGGDWVDAIAFHFYGYDESAWTYAYTVGVYRLLASNAGYGSLPLYVTESGMLAPTANEGVKLQRRMLTFAALGCKAFVGYASDYGTNPMLPFASNWNATAAVVAGATITRCQKNADGSVTATVNGAAYTV